MRKDDDPIDEEFLTKIGFSSAKEDIKASLKHISEKIAASNQEIISHADDIKDVYNQLPTGKNMKGWKRVSKRSIPYPTPYEAKKLSQHMAYVNNALRQAQQEGKSLSEPPKDVELQRPELSILDNINDAVEAIDGQCIGEASEVEDVPKKVELDKKMDEEVALLPKSIKVVDETEKINRNVACIDESISFASAETKAEAERAQNDLKKESKGQPR